MKKVDTILREVFSLYEQFGAADYIGEPVSQLEHMSQSAQLAIHEGFDDEVVLAAFFHDIGHICVQQTKNNSMRGFGVTRHERIGAEYLRYVGFPERIARLVENHVQAKRYLTFRYPDYYHRLSDASKATLEMQGGKMTLAEALHFESDPLFEVSLQLRKWDEQAKEVDVPIMDLSILKEKARQILSAPAKLKHA